MATETRESVLAHALQLFSKRGYEGVGVQEIAASAGVTKPTLYYYFKSKQGLLCTLLNERLSPMLAALDDQDATDDIESGLHRCAETVFGYATADPEMYRLFLALIFAPPESPQFEEAAGHAKRQFLAMERHFQHALEEGVLQDAPALLAATFQGAIHNYITLFLLGHIQLDRHAAQDVVHRFIHGIRYSGK